MLFIFGLCQGGRGPVDYCLWTELCPEKSHSFITTSWQMSEAMITILLSAYFWIIRKSWIWPEIYAFVIHLSTTLIIALFIPESPKWLYEQ
jgi:hypothetical protein